MPWKNALFNKAPPLFHASRVRNHTIAALPEPTARHVSLFANRKFLTYPGAGRLGRAAKVTRVGAWRMPSRARVGFME